MFETGKAYKVKIESTPGDIRFGRATIVEKSGSQLHVQIKTSRDGGKPFPQGTKLWFVSDISDISFNGLWASSIVGTSSKSTYLCQAPKLEPLLQRRRTPRVDLDVPVKITDKAGQELVSNVRSVDISRSGIAIQIAKSLSEPARAGDLVHLEVDSSVGIIEMEARVIRTDRNWLANKTLIGLEYTDVSDDSVQLLDKLLVLLGGKPRHQEAQAQAEAADQAKKPGLSGWMVSAGRETPSATGSRFVGRPSQEMPMPQAEQQRQPESTESSAGPERQSQSSSDPDHCTPATGEKKSSSSSSKKKGGQSSKSKGSKAGGKRKTEAGGDAGTSDDDEGLAEGSNGSH